MALTKNDTIKSLTPKPKNNISSTKISAVAAARKKRKTLRKQNPAR